MNLVWLDTGNFGNDFCPELEKRSDLKTYIVRLPEIENGTATARIIELHPDIVLLADKSIFMSLRAMHENGNTWLMDLRKSLPDTKVFFWCLADPHFTRVIKGKYINKYKDFFSHIDCVFSNCMSAEELYSGTLGCRFKFLPLYANISVFHPLYAFTDSERIKFASDVSFAGYAHHIDVYRECKFLREEIFLEVIRNKFDFKIYGTGWSHFSKRVYPSSGRYPIDKINMVYQLSKINLGLNVYTDYGYLNAKAFEVGASGGFPILENIGGLDKLFKIDKEIVVFDTKKELTDKIRYYLANEDKRKKICDRLHAKVMKQYTVKNVAEAFMEEAKKRGN